MLIDAYGHINDIEETLDEYIIHAFDYNFEWDWFITIPKVDEDTLNNYCYLIDTAFTLWYIDDLGVTPTENIEELLDRYNYKYRIETKGEEDE